MSPLPRVEEFTREKISQEFDALGLEACRAQISQDLLDNNPELLEMVQKCLTDCAEPDKILIGFLIFYQLLIAQSSTGFGELTQSYSGPRLNPLPRVTPETRTAIIRRLDREKPEAFTMSVTNELEKNNPELLQMAHSFASGQKEYLRIMQGFSLLYAALLEQAIADRAYLH